jgi:hypothetical protein
MSPGDKDAVSKEIVRAAKRWRQSKNQERASRDALADLVRQAVGKGDLTENKIAQLTEIPRMTIRKMLGKT